MKTPQLLRFPVLLAMAAAACSVSAQVLITLNPTADTFLMKSYDDVSAVETPQNSANSEYLYVVQSFDDAYQSVSLLYFDLSPYSGIKVTSDATLTLYYDSLKADSYGLSRTIEVRLLATAFDPATATFNNYSATNWSGADSLVFTFNDVVGTGGQIGDSGSLTFALTSGILQSWIDSPETNFGIALVGETPVTADIYGYSMESSFPPELSFTAVPEPSTYAALAGAAVLGLALWRRRGFRRTANP